MGCRGGSCRVSISEYSCGVCTWSPNQLWRSNSIFNLWLSGMILASQVSPAAATRRPAASSSDSSLEDSGSNRKEKKRKRGKFALFIKISRDICIRKLQQVRLRLQRRLRPPLAARSLFQPYFFSYGWCKCKCGWKYSFRVCYRWSSEHAKIKIRRRNLSICILYLASIWTLGRWLMLLCANPTDSEAV